MAEGDTTKEMSWAAFRRGPCFLPAVIWGAAAALLGPVLLRGSLPGPILFVLGVAVFAAVMHVARKRCAGATLAEIAAAPVAAPLAAAVERVVQKVEAAVSTAQAAPEPAPAAEPAPAPEPASTPEPAPAADPAPTAGMTRPAGLQVARGGGADDLKRLRGIGRKLETLLHSLGVYHFDQIAAWTPKEVAWMDEHLEGFRGRVTRDDWVGQARILAKGGVTSFAARVDAGDVPSSQA